MNRINRIAIFVIVGTVGNLMFPAFSFACPNCYGDPNSSMAQGMSMAILGLLGVTGGVLVAFGSFFIYLRKRALMMNKLFSNRLN